MEKIRLNTDENKLNEDHQLNRNLEIPFMEAGGAYHVIAKICGLEYIGNGIFKIPGGRKYILTKFGFELCTQWDWQLRYAETIQELRKLRSDYDVMEENCERKIKGALRNLEDQVRAKNEKIKNQKETLLQYEGKITSQVEKIKNQTKAITNNQEKIEAQAKQIKDQTAKIRELYALLAANGVNWKD